MKDSVNTLFQQRFQGHEAPVDPAVWQGIEQQLAATAPASDGVNKLFQDRFNGHEVPVDPAVWNSISSQLGHTVTTGTAAGTIWGWAAAGIGVIAIGAAVLWGTSEQGPVAQELPSTPTDAPAVAEKSPAPSTVLADLTTTEPASSNTTSGGVAQRAGAARPVNVKRMVVPAAVVAQEPQALNQPGLAVTPGPLGVVRSVPGEMIVESIIEELTTEVVKEVRSEPRTDPPITEPADPEPMTSPSDLGTAAPELPKLFMPNTFTPNGDMINDTYSVGSEGFSSLMLRVYSLKTNALVFSTNNGEAWTGANCEDGMYMVAAEARTTDGRTVTDGKVVWLNRNPMN